MNSPGRACYHVLCKGPTGGGKVRDGRRPELAEGKEACGGWLDHEMQADGKDLLQQKSRASSRRSWAWTWLAAQAPAGHGCASARRGGQGAGARDALRPSVVRWRGEQQGPKVMRRLVAEVPVDGGGMEVRGPPVVAALGLGPDEFPRDRKSVV